MATRFLIGKGELLTYDIPPPPIKPEKAHPYTVAEAKAYLVPKMLSTAMELQELPTQACPDDVAVAKIDIHPAYIAKSFFPKELLKAANLTAVGSRNIRVRPRNDLRKTAPPECDSTQLFIAGSRSAFARLPAITRELSEFSKAGEQLIEIEDFSAMRGDDRVRGQIDRQATVFEVGLHLLPDHTPEALQAIFSRFSKNLGFRVSEDLQFLAGRMMFVPVTGDAAAIPALSQFSLIRALRTMPTLRGARPVVRGSLVQIGFQIPTAAPLSNEPSVAILDGGLPAQHILGQFVRNYRKSDEGAQDIADYNSHGLGVTSAFLFGSIKPGGDAARPYAAVDHYRVLDAQSDDEDPYELYRTLTHVEDVLLSRQYQFINLSLGPDLPTDDNDVHAWTAVLDTLLSDGETLMTVAAGNNGHNDRLADLHRIQVPGDSVNALCIGASSQRSQAWQRAFYSAQGPGRTPGRIKPDILAFGGSPEDYFHVPTEGARPQLTATMGTSFAAPYALRSAVGIRAVLGEAVHPLTIKALLIHAAKNEQDLPQEEVGWGRLPAELSDIIVCGDGVARILYQGMLKPGKFLRAPVPLPPTTLTGMVSLTATFCYSCPVDVEDAAAYTKAGLGIRFRPNATKGKEERPKTASFFSDSVFRTEQEMRKDLGKWETVLHATKRMRGSSLEGACFDIHYNARDGGGNANKGSDLIRYALVLTLHAPKHADLYDQVLRSHAKLQALESRISLPVSSGSIGV